MIRSHFGKTSLSQLRVMRWDGSLPLTEEANLSRFQLLDGSTIRGNLKGFQPTTAELTIEDKDAERQIPLEQIVAAEFVTAKNIQSLAPLLVVLHDRSRISGELKSVDAHKLVLKSSSCLEPLIVPRHWIRSIVVQNSNRTVPKKSDQLRKGRLEMANHKVEGSLVPGKNDQKESCLVWQPQFSRTSSPLQRNASGRIIYIERKPPEPEIKGTQPQVRQVRQPNNLFGNFGKLFLKNAEYLRPVNPPATEEMHSLHLMSGDMLPCRVVSIDERGVHISSNSVEVNLIPHDKIKALVLQKTSKKLNLDDEKKERLLTLPRNQKSSPPTHLLYSPAGDYLRCRLMTYSKEQMKVEVHLSEMSMPSNRVSHIIWLHPEILLKEMKEKSAPPDAPLIAEKPEPQADRSIHDVQVIFADGNRSTFSPTEVTSTRIVGHSDVIGACSYLISSSAEIAFGEGINDAARELPFHQWVLTPAPEPLYMTATAGGSADDGLASAFVGKPAPDFRLDLLTGEPFVLSEQKGKIIALDFWATWCGPCILTMPLMEEAMKQFDPDQVELISVNMEERPEQVREVLERHQFSAKVAMDIDGAIGRRYQVDSIPQLVLVDQEGNVARLYIGGGQGVVDQFTASVKELLDKPQRTAGP